MGKVNGIKDHQESIKSQWDAVQSKMDELQILRKKLNCSLAIQTLWPEAFQLGKVTSTFSGNYHLPRSMKFKITAGDQSKEWSIFEIPVILIDRQIEIQLERAKYMSDKENWLNFKTNVEYYRNLLTRMK